MARGERKTFYICDRLACYEDYGGICNNSECRHTSKPEHALEGKVTNTPWLEGTRFVKDDRGNYWEYFWNIFKVEEEVKT